MLPVRFQGDFGVWAVGVLLWHITLQFRICGLLMNSKRSPNTDPKQRPVGPDEYSQTLETTKPDTVNSEAGPPVFPSQALQDIFVHSQVVVTGPTNSGKSSLVNALLGTCARSWEFVIWV